MIFATRTEHDLRWRESMALYSHVQKMLPIYGYYKIASKQWMLHNPLQKRLPFRKMRIVCQASSLVSPPVFSLVERA